MGTEHLTIGKGFVYFAPFLPGTQKHEGYRFVGNCPSFSLNHTSETLDHYKSTCGIRQLDKQVILETLMEANIECDEVLPDTLAYFFLTEATSTTVASAADQAYSIEAARFGRTYQIGETDSTPMGVTNLTSVSITTPAGLVEGTDYELDLDKGLITFLEGGTFVDNTQVDLTFSADAMTKDRIISASTQIEGALKFVSCNASGPDYTYTFPYAKMNPSGDLNLITDEWMTVPLNLRILQKNDLALAYVDGRPLVTG